MGVTRHIYVTPDDFESELERLGRRPRPECGVDEAWVQVRAATVDAERGIGDRRLAEGEARRRVKFAKGGTRGGLGMRTLQSGMGWLGLGTLQRNPTDLPMWRMSPTRFIGAFGAVMALLVAVVLVSRRTTVDPGTYRTYTTTVGQRAALLLADGTRATLAPQTTLRLMGFGQSSRTVAVDEGEVYFEVLHTAGTPFLVQSGQVTTRVLGTAFLVRHYGTSVTVRVAVASGKVSVSAPGVSAARPVTVSANQVADVGDSLVSVKTVDNMDPETGWVHDALVFHKAPMTDVLAALSRWYGYHFRFTDSLLTQQHVTLWLSTHSSAEALATLKQVLNVNLTVVGDTVTLTPAQVRIPGIRRGHDYDVFTPEREVGR